MRTAIIIGAGVGGLCTAIALQNNGIKTTVFEKAEMLGDVGAGLVLAANAVRSLRRMGLAEQAIAAGSKIMRTQIRTHTGDVLAETDMSNYEDLFGAPGIAIHRAALHKVLLGALPEGAVRLGAPCISVDQDPDGVTARFEDGSEARADFLIGADGVRSVIRRQLFPQVSLRYSGYTAWRGAVTSQDEAALGITSESWGRGYRFGIIRMDTERIYWFATANAQQGVTYPLHERKNMLLKIFGSWHHPIKHLLEATPAEAILHNDISDFAPMKQWSSGRITLLGDAAHATTPNMGQGACMAIESADVLGQCLVKNAAIETAFQEYETRRKPRTAFITNQSWQIGRVAQMENPLACAMRNFAVNTFSNNMMTAQLSKVMGVEA
ncbi:MAG: FAD-dependent monooxygenase [Anaerolineales bacterium]|uniref:FAD-dependent monooxygenase n=1 Tax=Candidatus Villigracilis vicinus TaxID=3140679 RepID=UPI0031365667|nr:FAD-dependent monooxygenase [Anaerolineales bacterium]